MRRVVAALVLATLAACEPVSGPGPAGDGTVSSVRFPLEIRPTGVARSNRQLSQDFLDLAFALEGGTTLDGLLRYEGPVRVVLRSAALTPYARDVDDLLARLRAEAGIDIRRTAAPEQAQLHIEAVPVRELQRVVPGAACFIIPGVTSWRGFRRQPSRARQRWSQQRTLGATAIFIPTDTPPQEVRACLHEEIAQALGPANDLFRLPDSVFNDDNRHTVLTPFDMLMLRTLYSPELASGMPRGVAAARVPAILDRINPAGRGAGGLPRAGSRPDWDRQIAIALSRGESRAARRRAADRAVAIARGILPADHRLAVSLVTRGRLLRESAPAQALRDFNDAYRLLAGRYGRDDIRTAQAAFHLALEAYVADRPAAALELIAQAKPVARAYEDAILLSSLLAVESRALEDLGRTGAARRARIDHLRWARYAYGEEGGRRARVQAGLEAVVAADIPATRRAER